jgi:hypothetical protein
MHGSSKAQTLPQAPQLKRSWAASVQTSAQSTGFVPGPPSPQPHAGNPPGIIRQVSPFWHWMPQPPQFSELMLLGSTQALTPESGLQGIEGEQLKHPVPRGWQISVGPHA